MKNVSAILLKECRKCLKTLPITYFFKEKTLKDGYMNQCKSCKKKNHVIWLRNNKNRYQKKSREYYQNNRLELKEKSLKRTKKNPLVYIKNYIAKYPEREVARRKVFSALRNGALKKETCFVCQSSKVEAHHNDYSKPLKIVWLCKIHHNEFHRKDNIFKQQKVLDIIGV